MEVDEEYGLGLLACPGAGHGVVEGLEDEGAVRQPGEPVEAGLLIELALPAVPLDGDGGEVGCHLTGFPFVFGRCPRFLVPGADDAEEGLGSALDDGL